MTSGLNNHWKHIMKESQISNNSNRGYFSWEQMFCIERESRSVITLLRDVSYRLTTSFIDYSQHLDSCFIVGTNHILNALQQQYKSGTTTELQKYISVLVDQTMSFQKEMTRIVQFNLPFCFFMTIAYSCFFHQVKFWGGKAFHWNFEKWLLLAKGIVLTRTAAPSGR